MSGKELKRTFNKKKGSIIKLKPEGKSEVEIKIRMKKKSSSGSYLILEMLKSRQEVDYFIFDI